MRVSRAATEWIGFKTIIIREFSRIVRIWGQTIVPPAVTATLYFIIFGSLIGRRVGQVGGGILRGVLVGSVVTIVSLFFTRLALTHVFAVISAVLLTSMVFALGGFINALFANNFDHISWFPTFVLTPLTYLGGVFYSITMLPGWAHIVSHANPILYMVSAFRFGFLGTSDVDLRLAYAIMVSAAAGMFALAVALLNRGTGIRD